MRLNFDETGILSQVLVNISSNPSKTNLIAYLTELENNSDEDKLTRQPLRSLREKMINVSQEQLNKMYCDLADGKMSQSLGYAIDD